MPARSGFSTGGKQAAQERNFNETSYLPCFDFSGRFSSCLKLASKLFSLLPQPTSFQWRKGSFMLRLKSCSTMLARNGPQTADSHSFHTRTTCLPACVSAYLYGHFWKDDSIDGVDTKLKFCLDVFCETFKERSTGFWLLKFSSFYQPNICRFWGTN